MSRLQTMSSPITVAELALRLHQTEKPALRLELEPGTAIADAQPGEGYELAVDSIEFASLAQRNRRVADLAYAHVAEDLASTPGLLFERANELWRRESAYDDFASARLLALAAQQVDVLSLAAQRIREGHDPFEVLLLLEAAVPFLDNMTVESLVDLCDAKFEGTKDDLASGTFHQPLESWLGSRPATARQLHRALVARLSDATANLLSSAIVGLAMMDYAGAFELARDDATDASMLRARVGIWTLGRLLNVPSTAAMHDEVCTAISGLMESPLEDVRKQAIVVATRSMHLVPAFDHVLKELAVGGDQDVLAGVATSMFLRSKEMNERSDCNEWIDLMDGLAPGKSNAIRSLDFALSRVLDQPDKVPVVVAMITRWTERHGTQALLDDTVATSFDSTFEKLCTMEPAWSALLTDWLLREPRQHVANLACLFSKLQKLDAHRLHLHKERLDSLSEDDFYFLARRMLGFVLDRQQVTNLALSMVESHDAKDRIFPLLRLLLVDEIGYDYPGSTADACRAAVDGAAEETVQFLNAVVEALETLDRSLEALPRRRELHPPAGLRHQLLVARWRKMNEDMDRARKSTLLSQMATEIPVKAGQGSFSYFNASYGPPMKMVSFSHSIEVPRRKVFDPVGNEIRIMNFRLAKKGAA